jgi:hypothetical protein
MIEPRSPQGRYGSAIEVSGKVEAGNLGAQCAGDLPDVERAVGHQSPGRISTMSCAKIISSLPMRAGSSGEDR